MNMITESQKQTVIEWAEKHKKGILIGMVLILFISLLILIAGLFAEKPQKETPFKQFQETTDKVGKTAKTTFNQAVDINELYKNANQIIKKDSLTKEDYAYLRMVDSTFKTIMKQK